MLMQDLDDSSLLREYAERGSEEAFAAIVRRHIDKVYSVALRHTRNPLQAEEITQAVFLILAQKAAGLSKAVILSGWLYQTARLASLTFIRSEIRRTHREHEAYMENLANQNEPAAWDKIAPLIDTAMAELSESDRHAVVLRFFDGKSLSEVGGVMGTSEDAAKKRVSRAVEKLQKFFQKRGIDSSAEAITASISSNAVQPAPVALLQSVTALALAKGTAASGSTLSLIKGTLKTMTWLKMKFVAVAGLGMLIAATGVTAVYQAENDSGGAGGGAAANADANLTLQWRTGKKYSMRFDFLQTTSTPLPGQPQPAKSAVNFTMEYNISVARALDASGKQLDLEFVNDTLDVSQDGNDLMKFDSTSPDDPAHNPARAPIGAHILFDIDASGKVLRVEGMDGLMERISATGKSAAPAVFKEILSELTLKKLVSFDDSVPNRKVKIGENWKIQKDVPSKIGSLGVDVTCTFKKWDQRDDRQCAYIESHGDFSSKKAALSDGAMMEIKKGRVFSESWFDPQLGMMVGSSADEMMSMTIGARGATFSPQVNQNVHLTLLAVE